MRESFFEGWGLISPPFFIMKTFKSRMEFWRNLYFELNKEANYTKLSFHSNLRSYYSEIYKN